MSVSECVLTSRFCSFTASRPCAPKITFMFCFYSPQTAVTARMIRSSLLEVLSEDYIRTARAKGVFERLVVSRHALRNALLPAITVIGLEFTFLIGGLVVTEQVFNLNGIGKLFVQSVSRSDFTMIQGMVMLLAAIYVVVNLVVDLTYGYLDPRVRFK